MKSEWLSSLTQHRRIEDGIEARLELLPILDRERTGTLAGRAARRARLDHRRRHRQDVTSMALAIEVDTSSGNHHAQGRTRSSPSRSRASAASVRWEERATQDRALNSRSSWKTSLEGSDRSRRRRSELDQALRRARAGAGTGIKPELDEATDAVNRAALREKAAQTRSDHGHRRGRRVRGNDHPRKGVMLCPR